MINSTMGPISFSSGLPFPFPVNSVTLWVDADIGIDE
jgi:hypothetical protein